MIDWSAVLAPLNAVALLVFTALIGAGIFGMVRRIVLFHRAEKPIPLILKRDLGLFGALAIIGMESLILRAAGISLAEADPFIRVVFAAHWDLILIVALAYWAKVELWDVDDPHKS